MDRSRTQRRLVVAVAVIVVGIMVPANAALAVSRLWNSRTAPLTAKADGGATVAQGYGSWTISTSTDGTRYRGGAYLRDPQPTDADGVYFEMKTYSSAGLCGQPQGTSCTGDFYLWDTTSGGKYWSSSTWSPGRSTTQPINARASSHRAGLRVAEAHNSLPDIYSSTTVVGAINW
jgi:hypothetical protein